MHKNLPDQPKILLGSIKYLSSRWEGALWEATSPRLCCGESAQLRARSLGTARERRIYSPAKISKLLLLGIFLISHKTNTAETVWRVILFSSLAGASRILHGTLSLN